MLNRKGKYHIVLSYFTGVSSLIIGLSVSVKLWDSNSISSFCLFIYVFICLYSLHLFLNLLVTCLSLLHIQLIPSTLNHFLIPNLLPFSIPYSTIMLSLCLLCLGAMQEQPRYHGSILPRCGASQGQEGTAVPLSACSLKTAGPRIASRSLLFIV